MRLPDHETPYRRWAIIIALVTIALAIVLLGPYAYEQLRRETVESVAMSAMPAPPRSGEPRWSDLEPVDSSSARFEPGRALALAAPGGLGRLDLPGGALERPADVSIVRYEIPGLSDASGYALDLLPDGHELAEPARFELPLPQGLEPADVEIVVLDPETQEWVPEPVQESGEEGRTLVASLSHFSLRRIRVRPGLAYSFQEGKGRATLRLESDHQNAYQRYVDGRWKAVARDSKSYRDLMRAGRRGRHALITKGRLRALATNIQRAEVMRDHQRVVALPADSPHAHTGWVLVHRIDAAGRRRGESVVARVAGPPVSADLARAGVVAQLSRATMEALGLEWGREMGLDAEEGELTWIRVPSGDKSGAPLAHLPVELEAYEGPTERASALPM